MADSEAAYRSIQLFPGIAIYRTAHSPNWLARVWDSGSGGYRVKSTRMTSSVNARRIALEFAGEMLRSSQEIPTGYQFAKFTLELLRKEDGRVQKGERSIGSLKAMRWCIEAREWGLLDRFGGRDIRTISTADFVAYMAYLDKEKPHWAPSNKNTVLATFRNVLKGARDSGVISIIPETPRSRQQDNPRPFFRFQPLVPAEHDEVQNLLDAAQRMNEESVAVRWISVTDELRDILLFLLASFVRPTTTELYALRHRDISIAENPTRLIVTINDGKTGFRIANSLSSAVDVYKRTRERHPDWEPNDFIFLSEYQNRVTAGKVIQRQFKALMDRSGIGIDDVTKKRHTIYSLRHTAICMRIVQSEGRVNIFNLAKNAGTSVEQIERFYARHLPLSAEMARNLQQTGDPAVTDNF